MKNQTKIILLTSVLFLFCLASVSATDIQTDIISQEVESNDIATETEETNDISDKIVKTDNNIKKEASPVITVTSNNYNKYFEKNATGDVKTTDNVKSGDTLNLEGTFRDLDFNADKENLIITSVGKTAKLFNCTVYVDGTNNKNVKIQNLTIKNTKDDCEGFTINNAENLLLSDNNVYVNGSNSFALTSHYMKNSIIENNYFESVHSQSNMRIYSSNNNYILNNTIIGYADCIYLCSYDEETSNNNIIRYNTVIGKLDSPVCYTIQVMGSGNIIEENVVSGGYRGISSVYSNIIRNNDVDATYTGIFTSENSTIENNNIHVSNESTGITVSGAGSIVRNNFISTNETGIIINTNNVLIENNKIISRYAVYSQVYRSGYTGINITGNNITGSIYNTGSMTITNNKIQNSASDNGGAIYNTGTIVLNNNTFLLNNASSNGGAIYSTGNLTLNSNQFIQNSAKSSGIIHKTKGQVTAADNIFINNNPYSFIKQDNKLVLVDNGNFIPVNADVQIYEEGVSVKKTTMKDGVIDYNLKDNVTSYTIIVTNTTNTSFKNNNFTFTNDKITVKKDLIIVLDPIKEVKYGNNVTITGKFLNDNGSIRANNNVKIAVNGKTASTKTDSNGVFTFSTKIGAVGINNVTASHSGDSTHNPTSTSTTFTMVKQDLHISLDTIKDVSYTDNVTISGRFTEGDGVARANNNVKIVINGKSGSAKTDANGYFTFTSIIGKVGLNNVTVSHSGGSNYNPTSKSSTYTVSKQNLKIVVDSIKQVMYGENVTITGRFTDSKNVARANSSVKILINGKSASAKTDSDGYFTFTSKIGMLGVNNVTVSHAGGGNYNPTNTSTTYTVVKQDLKITINKIKQVSYGNSVTVTGKFTDAFGNVRANTNLKVIINGKTATARTDADGVFSLTSKVGSVGINNVTVSHAGGGNYNPTNTSTTFTMVKQDLKITVNSIKQTKVGSNVVISGKFTDGLGNVRANTNLKVVVNGKTYSAKTDAKGLFTYTLVASVVGTNNVTVSHSGGANYNPTNTTAVFTVTKA